MTEVEKKVGVKPMMRSGMLLRWLKENYGIRLPHNTFVIWVRTFKDELLEEGVISILQTENWRGRREKKKRFNYLINPEKFIKFFIRKGYFYVEEDSEFLESLKGKLRRTLEKPRKSKSKAGN